MLDIGIRPDGLVTYVSPLQVETIDPRSVPVGAPIALRNITNTRVRSDGLVHTLSGTDFELYDLNGSELIEQVHKISESGFVASNDEPVLITEASSGRVESIHLASGVRTQVQLRSADG